MRWIILKSIIIPQIISLLFSIVWSYITWFLKLCEEKESLSFIAIRCSIKLIARWGQVTAAETIPTLVIFLIYRSQYCFFIVIRGEGWSLARIKGGSRGQRVNARLIYGCPFDRVKFSRSYVDAPCDSLF